MMDKQLSRVIKDSTGQTLNLDHPMPGVYYGISAIDYFSIVALNQSTLKKWVECIEDVVLAPNKDGKPTTYNVFGTQYHAFLLEPTEFEARFVAGRAKRQSFEDKVYFKKQVEFYGDEVYIYRPKDLEVMKAMKEFMVKHYAPIYAMLSEKYPTEITVIWRDAESGLLCKARIDKYLEEFQLILDLKTTKNPREEPFFRDIRYYRYDYQGAWYRRGAWSAGMSVLDFGIVAQSKIPDYIVRSYQLSSDKLSRCDELITNDLLRYAEWISNGRPFPTKMIHCP